MQFDLKQTDIFLVDGYTEEAAVNLLAGYTVGATSMVVSGVTGIIPAGASFTIASDILGTIYSVVSTVETLGVTTTINFTPALAEDVDDAIVITFGGRSLRIKVGEGTMTYDEKRPREYKKDRGKLDTVRDGDEEPLDVKIDLRWEFLRSDATDPVTNTIPSPEEVLKQTGAASEWNSSSEDDCEPFAIDIHVLYTPLCEGVKKELIVLKDFRYEQLSHDFKQGMLSCTGKCNVTEAVVTRL